MRLKRLEVYGFKSFATRSVLEFGEGIVAVVGPNGSGKSNIADAIRWVMGEQSYSLLRAKSTEDMIFGGTGTRARLGMAEVLITLDNTDGSLPVDYSEVVIGRRAFRSGENEYLLNGSRVRYRDILEVLGGAGLARSQYTVIGQGMVDAALALRPDARRALFEEAAGITGHLRKRADALRRIDETVRNLERSNDILQELTPRAQRLARQAERAEQHGLLQGDLQELQRIWYGYQWDRRQRLLAAAEEQIRKQRVILSARQGDLQVAEEGLRDLEGSIESQGARVEEIEARLSDVRRQVEAYEREQAINKERQRLYRHQRSALESEITELESRRVVLAKEIERVQAEYEDQQTTHRVDLERLAQVRESLKHLDASRQALRAEVASLEQELSGFVSEVANRRARLEELEQRRARLVSERDEMLRGADQLDEQITALQARVAEAEAELRGTEESRERLRGEMARLRSEIPAARQRLEEAETAVSQLTRARDGLISRQRMLRRMRQEMTGLYPGVRAVMNAGDRLHGVLGTVVSLMRVPEELETAIEAALGARLQNVVTETWDDASAAIALLKKDRLGRATFLPLDTVRPRAALRIRPGHGIVGVGSELVRYEARLQPVFSLLLGRVVIVRDLETARRLLGQRLGASQFVTLAGETVQPSGAVTGGSRRRSSDLVAQEREWRDLPARIEAARASLTEAESKIDVCTRDLAEQQRQRATQEEQVSRLTDGVQAASRKVTERTTLVDKARRECDWSRSRAEKSAQQLDALGGETAVLTQELGDLETHRRAAMERLGRARDDLESSDDEELRRRAASLETKAAVSGQSVASQQRLLTSHISNLGQLTKQIEDKSGQRDQLDGDLADLEAAVLGVSRRLTEVGEQVVQTREEHEGARQHLRQLENERREQETTCSKHRDRLRETETEHHRAIIDRDRAVDDLTTLAEEIETNLGTVDLPDDLTRQLRLSLGEKTIELPRVKSLPSGLSDQIRRLRGRLRRLGSVNLNAPDEYKQVMERKGFLESQQADLREAIASLREIIDQLDAVIERDFAATFDVVDAAFRKYFSRLFGGGSARLVLTDPDELSTTGVDIAAQPPGKRAQNLSLLSGGERALTAVALLFALLSANTVPFCCLDEVDAALDEANVHRFRDLLMEHAVTTQFVVITHNRHTIESASTIYGISMGERGISQCVSLKLDGRGTLREGASVAAGV